MHYTHTRHGTHVPFRMVAEYVEDAAPPQPPRIQARGFILAAVMASLVLVIAAAQARIAAARPPAPPPARVAAEFLQRPAAEIDTDIRAHKLVRGNSERREIALTFDDGPHPVSTRAILRILRQYRVKGTFFLIGDGVQRFPDVVREIAAGGHAIGNHTAHHQRLSDRELAEVSAEINDCGAAIAAVTGETPRLFRPPGGRYNRRVAGAAVALGYTFTQWSANPGDYQHPGADAIANRVLASAGNGTIVLLHDNVSQTMQALPRIIETLQARGYAFVTVEEMLSNRDTQYNE